MEQKKTSNSVASINIRSGAKLVGKLNAIADREGVTRGRLIRGALENFVGAWEDVHGEIAPRAQKKPNRE